MDTEGTEVGTENTKLASGAETQRVIGCAIEVHRHLGAGLLESVYQQCLAYEFEQAGIPFCAQQEVPVSYKSLQIPMAYRVDFLVDQAIVVELKSVEKLEPVHEAQVLSYMRLGGFRLGLLINFNVRLLKQGIRRFIL